MSVGAALAGLLGDLVAPRICWSCSDLVRRGDPLCARCRASLHRLAADAVVVSGLHVWAPVAYSGPARDLVRALKFRGAIALADTMAAQIVANALPGLLEGRAIVPVPLHPRRLRKRGYNQAAAVAAAVARRARLEIADCLVRSGQSVTQVGRNRAERTAGPVGEITATGRVPTSAVLVDDVVTTGATLGACRDALVANGALDVAAVAFARTIGR
jgi:ComF family protein